MLIKQPPADLLEQEAKSISYEMYASFLNNLFKKAFLEAALTGNLDKKISVKLIANLHNRLQFEPALKKEIKPAVLPQQPSIIYQPISREGKGLALIIDQGNFSYRKRAMQMLGSSILNSAFFYNLRSEEKVGYIAQSQDLETKERLYSILFLQSDAFSAEDMLAKSEKFLERFSEKESLRQRISKERFENLKQDFLNYLKQPPQTLNELAGKLNRCAFYYQDLNYDDHLVKAIDNVGYEDFLLFTAESFSPKNLKRTAVMAQKQKPAFIPASYTLARPAIEN